MTIGITLTSLTTLLTIMKYMSRPKSAAIKDIADILDQKYRVDIVSISYRIESISAKAIDSTTHYFVVYV